MEVVHNTLFNDLFIMELANNHLGSVERGIKIINDFSKVIKDNNVKAAIKLQFRDVDNFIHKDFLNSDERYIKKTLATKMSKEDYRLLIDEIRKQELLVAVTPFDEVSVKLCGDLNVDIIKIASSDINDWQLLSEVVKLKKPVVISTGGATFSSILDSVSFFVKNRVDIAVLVCTSLYPTEWNNVELNQIDYLKYHFNYLPIGISTHEYDIDKMMINMAISVAKGVSIFERHIDIEDDDIVISPYNSTPEDFDKYVKAYKIAKQSCGGSKKVRRNISDNEKTYLNKLKRGVYAKRDLIKNEIITKDDVYFAVPLQKDCMYVGDFVEGMEVKSLVRKDEPLRCVVD